MASFRIRYLAVGGVFGHLASPVLEISNGIDTCQICHMMKLIVVGVIMATCTSLGKFSIMPEVKIFFWKGSMA